MQSDPLHKLDCCLVTDGGGAVVLTTERTRPRPRRHADRESSAPARRTRIPTCRRCPTSPRPVRGIQRARAYAMAGINASDVDVALLYDSFTITVLLTLEGAWLLRPRRSGRVRRRRQDAAGRFVPAQHVRWRPVVLPSRHVRHVPVGRSGAAVARRVRRATGGRRRSRCGAWHRRHPVVALDVVVGEGLTDGRS